MKSGLQKYIRRNILDKALFCAGELDLFKHTPEDKGGARGEGIRTNFLHRLMIIYLEDIGNPSLWSTIDTLIFDVFTERFRATRNATKEENNIAKAIHYMCASTKARYCSHSKAVTHMTDPYARHILHTEPYKFPTVKAIHDAFNASPAPTDFNEICNKFQAALQANDWTAIHWGLQIESADVKVKEYGKRKPIWRLFRLIENWIPNEYATLHPVAMRWYSELEGLKEASLCWILLIVVAFQKIPLQETPLISDTTVANPWNKNLSNHTIELDDYVVDRHTAKGRSKGLYEFATVGAYVENESPYVNQEFKRFYERVKLEMDAGDAPLHQETLNIISVIQQQPQQLQQPSQSSPTAVKESDKYQFIVRTQINTSSMKSDVYFATERATGKLVVVKGPLNDTKDVQNSLEIQEWKKANGLPYLQAKLECLIPDLWSEGVPLGLRNKVSRTAPAPFLVSDSLIDRSALQTKEHSSKVWPPTKVIDWDKVPLHFDIDKANYSQIKSYIQAILVRYIFGISDLADRNFLVYRNTVIAVDEEYRNNDVNFQKELKKTKCAKITEWLKVNYDALELNKFQVADKYATKLKTIQNKNECIQLFHLLT